MCRPREDLSNTKSLWWKSDEKKFLETLRNTWFKKKIFLLNTLSFQFIDDDNIEPWNTASILFWSFVWAFVAWNSHQSCQKIGIFFRAPKNSTQRREYSQRARREANLVWIKMMLSLPVWLYGAMRQNPPEKKRNSRTLKEKKKPPLLLTSNFSHFCMISGMIY